MKDEDMVSTRDDIKRISSNMREAKEKLRSAAVNQNINEQSKRIRDAVLTLSKALCKHFEGTL